MLTKSEIKLGDEYEDVVTGFKGIAVEKTEYINGCVQLLIRPRQTKDHKKNMEFPKGIYLDVESLRRVGRGINERPRAVTARTGGPARTEDRQRA